MEEEQPGEGHPGLGQLGHLGEGQPPHPVEGLGHPGEGHTGPHGEKLEEEEGCSPMEGLGGHPGELGHLGEGQTAPPGEELEEGEGCSPMEGHDGPPGG